MAEIADSGSRGGLSDHQCEFDEATVANPRDVVPWALIFSDVRIGPRTAEIEDVGGLKARGIIAAKTPIGEVDSPADEHPAPGAAGDSVGRCHGHLAVERVVVPGFEAAPFERWTTIGFGAARHSAGEARDSDASGMPFIARLQLPTEAAKAGRRRTAAECSPLIPASACAGIVEGPAQRAPADQHVDSVRHMGGEGIQHRGAAVLVTHHEDRAAIVKVCGDGLPKDRAW
jgi:hypothetical protein